MSLRIVFSALFVGLAAWGCATTAKYERMLGEWVGRDSEAIVDHWGYPDREVTAPNGNRVFVYDEASLWQTPMTVTPGHSTLTQHGNRVYVRTYGGYVDGGDIVFSRCSTYFEVDERSVVVRTKFKGNACRSR